MNKSDNSLFRRAAIIAFLSMTVAGCDNGSAVTSSRANSTQVQISGHVLNDNGPVNQGQVEAKDPQGKIAAQTRLNGQSTYTLTLPPDTNYPLIIRVDSEAEPKETLKAAVMNQDTTVQDITPVTTIVVDTALSLGGLSEANLAKAAGSAIAQRKKSGGGSGSAGSSESFKGDPTKQYGGWH